MGSFHLGSENFQLVALPNFEDNDYLGGEVHRFSFLLGESMAIFGLSPSRRCVWVMQEDGERVSWKTKWYKADYPAPLSDKPIFYTLLGMVSTI